jgi:hypothetical protein
VRRALTLLCQANRPLPPVNDALAFLSFAFEPPRKSSVPESGVPGCVIGTRSSITFTTPPTALLPYSSVDGPRTISMLSAFAGSTLTL